MGKVVLNKEAQALVTSRVAEYNFQKKAIQAKAYNSIPFYGLDKLNTFIPGIIPGIMYKVTSHSGVGKTHFTKFTFVYKPIEFAIKHAILFTCFYIALEESVEEFIDSLFLYILRTKFKLFLKRFNLNGLSQTPLSDAEMKIVNEAAPIVAQYLSYIHLIDDSYKPTELFEKIKALASEYGTFEEHIDVNGRSVEMFTPHIKGHKFLVVTDHISLIEEEYDEELKQTLKHSASIAKWHTKMLRKIITKQWKFTSVVVQQQSLESEKQQFTSKGDTILTKVIPSIDGLGNNKEIARDDYVIIALFSPERYPIPTFRGYRISNELGKNDPYFGDNFRSAHILKARFGIPNQVIPLYFDGSYGYFEELPIPIPANKSALDTYYQAAETARKLRNT